MTAARCWYVREAAMEPGDGGRVVTGLPGGGSLGVADFGDPAGVPCFAFHGLSSSRLMPGWLFPAELLAAAGVRMMGVGRPGYGLSKVPGAAGFSDGPGAVGALADHLGIGRFAVLAHSLVFGPQGPARAAVPAGAAGAALGAV